MKPPNVDEGPYVADTTEETDMTEQAAAPTPEDTIEISNDNDNDEEDKEDNNTLHSRTVRKQVCDNDPEEESLFSEDGDNDHNDNDPDDDYSESTDDENKKKKSKRKTPRVPFGPPGLLTVQAVHHLPQKRRRWFWLL